MDADFWHERWQTARIGFHRQQVNTHLTELWPQLNITPASQVLVPLCGKSNDLLWLAEQGYAVTGFELSPIAVTDFFSAAKLEPTQAAVGPYQCWQAEHLHIYQGDFFRAAELNQQFAAAYDRAALIALPKRMQEQYVALLAKLLKPGATVLLITVHYAPEQQNAPPFSVDETRVQDLFSPYFSVTMRGRHHEGQDNPRVAGGELSFFDELCFELVRNCE